MPKVLFSKHTISQFKRKVLPLLEAKGIGSNLEPAEAVEELTKRDAEIWAVPVEMPISGKIYELSLNDRPWRLFETVVELPSELDLNSFIRGNQAENENDSVAVQVEHVSGRRAFCTLVDGEPGKPRSTCQPLLVMSMDDVVVLADVIEGLDCFDVVDIWPAERMPLQFLHCRPAKPGLASDCDIEGELLEHGKLDFAVACHNCTGAGHVTCEQCEGSGIYLPRKKCPKCGGSGDFIGKYGDVMGKCHACDGKGYFPAKECYGCNGSGSIDCWVCKETGALRIGLDYRTGRFSIRKPVNDEGWKEFSVPFNDVFIYDWERKSQLSGISGAQDVLEAIYATAKAMQEKSAEVEKFVRDMQNIEICLDRSIEAQEVVDLRPLELSDPAPSLQRKRHGVIYEYRMAAKRNLPWLKDRILPYPQGTPLNLSKRNSSGRREDWQPKTTVPGGEDDSPSFFGIDFSKRRHLVKFPDRTDKKDIPEDITVKPDRPPPSEKTQIRHLQHWCSWSNRYSGILRTMVLGDSPPDQKPEMLFNKNIENFKSQIEAVSLGISNRPLSLIKGPPGAGKTTIITEIVRQAAARGEKILVASQTHQAVRNVLERLHEDGRFRMIRHGHDAKLSELEKQYTEDGLSGETARIIKKTESVTEQWRERTEWLTDGLEKCKDAVDAASELADVRKKIEKDISQTKAKADSELSDAMFRRDSAAECAQEKKQVMVNECSPDIRRLEKQKKKSSVKLKKIRKKSSAVLKRMREKFGYVETPPDEKTGGEKRLRDALIPVGFASEKTLKNKLAGVHWQTLENETRIEKADVILKSLHSQLEDGREECERAVRKADAVLGNRKAKIMAEKETSLADATQRRSQAENRLCSVQVEALPAAKEFNPSLSSNDAAGNWSSILPEVEKSLEEAEGKLDFMSNYSTSLVNSREALYTLLNDSLQVFFSTCVGLASWRDAVSKGKDAFDIVIIDEAAHATVTETLTPLLYTRRALLVGDEKQLPPIVTGKLSCRPYGRPDTNDTDRGTGCWMKHQRTPACRLEQSLFEMLWNSDVRLPQVMLDIQFRMHPDIADFVSATFYDGKLKSEVSKADRRLAFAEFTHPVCLVPTNAYKNHHEELLDPGFRNEVEACIIARIVKRANGELTESQTCGIITPYAGQVHLLQRELGKAVGGDTPLIIENEDIASVHRFQGSERDIIIISFVRSPKPCDKCHTKKTGRGKCPQCGGKGFKGSGLSFVRDLKMLNVAFSRARKMLILVGDIESLSNPDYQGGKDGIRILKDFQSYVSDRGRVLHVWEKGYGE